MAAVFIALILWSIGFANTITKEIILAPHTSYTEVSPNAEAEIGVTLQDTVL